MLSPRSRGKGSRRVPGRDGGRGKRRVTAWRKPAVHSVEKFSKESGDIVEIIYSFPYERSAAESIYLFDQRVAGTGIHYQADLSGSFFVIRVPASAPAAVKVTIAQIKG